MINTGYDKRAAATLPEAERDSFLAWARGRRWGQAATWLTAFALGANLSALGAWVYWFALFNGLFCLVCCQRELRHSHRTMPRPP